jgi:hypothetical protein
MPRPLARRYRNDVEAQGKKMRVGLPANPDFGGVFDTPLIFPAYRIERILHATARFDFYKRDQIAFASYDVDLAKMASEIAGDNSVPLQPQGDRRKRLGAPAAAKRSPALAHPVHSVLA